MEVGAAMAGAALMGAANFFGRSAARRIAGSFSAPGANGDPFGGKSPDELRTFNALQRESIDIAAREGCCLSIQAQQILGVALLVFGILAILFSAGAAAGVSLLDMLGGGASTVTILTLAASLLVGTIMTIVGALLFHRASSKEFVSDLLKRPFVAMDVDIDRVEAAKRAEAEQKAAATAS